MTKAATRIIGPLQRMFLFVAAHVFSVEHSYGGGFAPRGEITLDQRKLKVSEAALNSSFLELIPDGYYRVRVGGASTSIRACELVALNMEESFELQLDAAANILSISYKNVPPTADCQAPASLDLTSTATLSLDIIGQIIPVQVQGKPPPSFADALKEDKPQGPVKKSFFARYWHIIIPIMLILLTAKAPEPESA